jgi:hypothetical protein
MEKLAKYSGGKAQGTPAQSAPYWKTIAGRGSFSSAPGAGDRRAMTGSMTTAARETATVSTSSARIVAMRSPERSKR